MAEIVNIVFAIGLWGWLTKLAWTKSAEYAGFGGFLSTILSTIFGCLCLLQIFAMIAELGMGVRTQPNAVDNQIAGLHAEVLSAFYKKNKGGVVVSCNNYMLAIEFDGPLRNGGLYGEMAFVGRGPKRNSRSAKELGRIFLDGETIHFIECNESDFFRLLSKYNEQARYTDRIDVKSGLPIYSVKIAK